MRRYGLSDEHWNRIKTLLPRQPDDPGVTAADNRLIGDTLLWIARSGAPPWRDLPERFGNWNTIWRSFNRWAKQGVWQRVFLELQDIDMEWMFLNFAIFQAHSDAASQKGGKKRKLMAIRVADLAPKSKLQSKGWAIRSNFD